MATYACEACGDSFDTLTRLRIHEKDDCSGRKVYTQLDPDACDVADQGAEGLLTCRNCGRMHNSGDYTETPSWADGDYHLIVAFDCLHCGSENENRLVMEGVDASDLDDLPDHLQPRGEA